MNRLFSLQSLHKWLGLFVGLQLFVWMLSGLTFNLLSPQAVSGRALVNPPKNLSISMPEANFDLVVKRFPNALSISLAYLSNQMVYLVKQPDAQVMLSTITLEPVMLNQALISQLAKAHYNGDGELLRVVEQTQRTTENRRFKLPVWQAEFSDEQHSSLYFDGVSGAYVGIRGDTWRIFDFMWMLHMMDYSERSSFNHPLIILVASGGLFLGLSGFILLFYSISWRDFRWFLRVKKLPVRIIGKGGFDSEIFVKRHASLYGSLRSVGFELPSQCGGGGTCKLCKVRLTPADSPIAKGHGSLSADELADGYRLACQMRVDSGLVVELPEKILHQQVLECSVVSNAFVTPLIKELVIRLPPNSGFSFVAGEYVQLHCPAGDTALSEIEVPQAFQEVWKQRGVDKLTSNRTQAVLRPYSVANPPTLGDELQFNIRLALPDKASVAVGAASSYLFTLRPGENIDMSGPFGYFHALDGNKEMIFVGGGAGLAPLRSHILHQLNATGSKRKIRFFYGAKTMLDIFHQAQFDRLAKEHDNFEWTVALSEPGPADNWPGAVGNIDQVLFDEYLAKHDNVKNCEFYFCGPPMMNRAMYQLVAKLDIPRDQVKCDDFWTN